MNFAKKTNKLVRIFQIRGESFGYGLLIVHENLWMFSPFYGLLSKEVNLRIKHLLDIVGMGNRFSNKSLDLSTGLRKNMKFHF